MTSEDKKEYIKQKLEEWNKQKTLPWDDWKTPSSPWVEDIGIDFDEALNGPTQEDLDKRDKEIVKLKKRIKDLEKELEVYRKIIE